MRAIVVCATPLFLCLPAVATPEPTKPVQTVDSAVIAEKMLDRVDIDEGLGKLPLKDVLDYLQKRTGITFLLDARALIGAAGEGNVESLENTAVTLPPLKRVRVETVVRMLTDILDADFYIAPDHVKITTSAAKDLVTGQAKRLPELYPQPGEEVPEFARNEVVRSTPYVTVSFKETPLVDALKELGTRAGRNVVVSDAAAEKAKSRVTVTLTNTAFETAASSLAEATGLRAFRNGNVVVIVTAERARQAEAKLARLNMGPFVAESPPELEAKLKLLEEKLKELEKARK